MCSHESSEDTMIESGDVVVLVAAVIALIVLVPPIRRLARLIRAK